MRRAHLIDKHWLNSINIFLGHSHGLDKSYLWLHEAWLCGDWSQSAVPSGALGATQLWFRVNMAAKLEKDWLGPLRSEGRGLFTFYADVARLQVGHEVLATRLELQEVGVEHLNRAILLPRAAVVQQGHHIRGASNVITGCQAPTHLHPAEARRLHEDDLARRTGAVERLWVAVFLHIWKQKKTQLI